MRYALHDIEAPSEGSLEDGHVLLRFLAGGICGSDIARYRDGCALDGPEPFGRSLHEIVGEVVASHSDLKVGERVVGWVKDLCGLREYLTAAANELLPVPPGLEPVHAVAMQPLACVLYALSRVPGIAAARTAVIGLGPIGLLFAHTLKDLGVGNMVGVDVIDRSDVATTFGLDEVVQRSSRMWARTRPEPGEYDIVVEAIGHQVGTLDDAIAVAAPHGTVLYFGIPDDNHYPLKIGVTMDKNLVLRFGRTPRPDRRHALTLAAEYFGRYPDLAETYVTHVLPASEAQRAYQLASRPARGQLKIVLDATA